MSIRVMLLPVRQLGGNGEALDLTSFPKEEIRSEDVFGDARALFFQSGRLGIDYLARHFGLGRNDETLISSTSDSGYVSSCVTCTLFKYCRVSRVLTGNTRMIWIIHEFGFPNPRTEELIAVGKELGIPVVEDSAHSMDSFLGGRRLGHLADFGLYSLPKTFPVSAGGVLVGRHLDGSDFEPDMQRVRGEEFNRFLPFLRSLSTRRREIYRRFQAAFIGMPEVYRLTGEETPFAFAFLTQKAAAIYMRFEAMGDSIEPLRTHNDDWVTLPVNPFVTDQHIDALIEIVSEEL
jgi:hypothetical protein